MVKISRGEKNFAELRRLAEQMLVDRPMDRDKQEAIDVNSLIHEIQVYQMELEMQNEELRRAQLEIETGREKYVELYDHAPIGYFTLDKNGLILEANSMGASMLEVEKQRLTERSFVHFVAQEDRDIFYLHRNKAAKSGKLEQCELRLIKGEATFFAQLESMVEQGVDADAGIQLKTVISNIDKRKQAEEALRLSEERFYNIFLFAPIGMAIITYDATIVESNDFLQKMLGYSGEELRGMRVAQITHPADRERTRSLVEELHSGKRAFFQMEKRYLRKDGTLVWGHTTAGCVRGPDGRLFFSFAMIQDITGQKQSAEIMARFKDETEVQERKRLAKRVHDGPLQAMQVVLLGLKKIMGSCQQDPQAILHKCQQDPQAILHNLEGIAEDVTAIVTQLREVSTEFHPSFLDRMDLIDAVRWMGDKFERRSGISVRIEGGIGLTHLEARVKRHCFLIFQEALTNAVKHSGSRDVRVTFREMDDDTFQMEISDQGQGFNPEKVNNRSEGIGLAIIRERVERLGGELRIQSAPGKGTSILVKAPSHG